MRLHTAQDEAVLDTNPALIVSKHEIYPAKPRTVGRQQHRANVKAENPSQYWKRSQYLPYLDHLTTELTDKLADPLLGYEAQYLILIKLPGLYVAAIADIYTVIMVTRW